MYASSKSHVVVKSGAVPKTVKAELESQIKCLCYAIFSLPMRNLPLDKPLISPTEGLPRMAFLSTTPPKWKAGDALSFFQRLVE
jgi:hypothetical protein